MFAANRDKQALYNLETGYFIEQVFPLFRPRFIGTTLAKACAVSSCGEIFHSAGHAYKLSRLPEGKVEQSVEDWYDVLCQAVADCVSRLPDGAQICGLAISSQGGSVAIFDDARKPLAPAVTWLDSRGW